MSEQLESFDYVKAQRDILKRDLDKQKRWELKPAAALTNDGSVVSMLLLLCGLALLTISIMLWFFSPSRYLRSEVVDAMVMSNALNINDMVSSLLISSRGVYIPASQAGATKVFLPLSSSSSSVTDVSIAPGQVFSVTGSAKGITLTPPGYGLFAYSRRIGALFTEEGMENEIRDIMENSLELASGVSVKRDGDKVYITMKDIANREMCSSLRKENPLICVQAGCPICSLLGCMVVDATGRKARVESVKAEGKTISLTYELL